jgi:hypothetical protein
VLVHTYVATGPRDQDGHRKVGLCQKVEQFIVNHRMPAYNDGLWQNEPFFYSGQCQADAITFDGCEGMGTFMADVLDTNSAAHGKWKWRYTRTKMETIATACVNIIISVDVSVTVQQHGKANGQNNFLVNGAKAFNAYTDYEPWCGS